MLDLVIRNGLIVDGSGLPGRHGDVSIHDGRVVAVGGRAGEAQRVLDATGRVVAPGFIDPHTHYDAQLCFDPYAFPAIEHGVTTVVPGNCSLSLAPLRVEQRDAFSRMFRLIEEMPEAAFDAGVDWRWGEGFGGWLDALAENIALNVAPLVGHSVLRMYVMGPDAQTRAATADEITAMSDLLRVCLEAGAVGLSTSFVDIDEHYRPVPSRWAAPAELDALSAVLGERDAVLQIVHEFYDTELTIARVEQLADLSLRHGITTTLSPLFHSDANQDGVSRIMAAVEAARARGAAVWPQVQTRPIDISFTLDQRSLMLLSMPSWWKIASIRDHADKLTAVADGRQALVDEMDSLARRPGGGLGAGGFVVRDVVHERNDDLIGRTIDDIARERGSSSGETIVDLALDENLGTWFIRESIGHDNSPIVGDLLAHPYVHVGASDGGAHVGSFSTFGDTGYLFSEFVRGTKSLSLEAAVKKVTLDPASIWGLPGRGLLAAGNAADVVVFDAATIGRGPGDRLRRLPRRRRPLDPPPGGHRHGRGERRGHLERRRRIRRPTPAPVRSSPAPDPSARRCYRCGSHASGRAARSAMSAGRAPLARSAMVTCSSTERRAERTAIHIEMNGSCPPSACSSCGRTPRTEASGPSSTLITSATVIVSAGRASNQPPSPPRTLRTSSPLRSWRRMSNRKPGGTSSRSARTARVTGRPGSSRSSLAIVAITRTP